MNFNQKPEFSPEKEKKTLAEAVNAAVLALEQELQKVDPLNMFLVNGKEYPVTNNTERAFANYQQVVDLAKKYAESKEGFDYRDEGGAKKILMTAEAYKEFAKCYAELQGTKAAKFFRAQGETFFKTANAPDTPDVANDNRFLVAS